MADILNFFDLKRHPHAITPRFAETESGLELIWFAQPGRNYQLQGSENTNSAVWRNIGAPITATGLTAKYSEALPSEALTYRVIRLN